MSRLIILSLAAIGLASAGCQKAKMGSTPPKPVAQATLGPGGPGGPIGPRQPPPMPPPRWGEPEPIDPVNPIVVGPPPPTAPPPEIPPRVPEPEKWDPRVIPVTPTPITPPKPPPTEVIPSERRGEIPKQPEPPPTRTLPTEGPPPVENPPPPTRTVSPITPQTEQPPTRVEGPVAPPPQQPPTSSTPTGAMPPPSGGFPTASIPAAAPLAAPPRNETPIGGYRPQGFNQFKPYRDVPTTQPMAEKFIETPPAESTVAEKAVPTAPTQILTASKPECIGPEGADCEPPKSVQAQCDAQPLESRETKGKLDILIVTDTSLSLRGGLKRDGGELVKIARELETFVRELPDQDIQIAVMAAHGPASRWHATLFNAGKGDRTVLQIPAISDKVSAEQRAALTQKAAETLANKMIHLPEESGGAQGEAMLLSVYDAFNSKAKLGQIIKRDKFLRPDAALNVLFITDEQDVCYDYKAESLKAGVTIEPTRKIKTIEQRDKKGRVTGKREERVIDPIETEFFKKSCAHAIRTADKKSRPLDHGDVHRVLMDYINNRPLVISAIGYKTNDIPVGVEDENEMARGIIDLVNLGGSQGAGIMADLAAVNRQDGNASFGPLLQFLGKNANSQIHFSSLWNCASDMRPEAVNPSSVVVRVLGRNGEELASFTGRNNEVTHHAAKGGAGNRIYSQFRLKDDKLLKERLKGKDTKDAVVLIDFMSVTGKDWKTGEPLRREVTPKPDAKPAAKTPAKAPAKTSAKPQSKPAAKAKVSAKPAPAAKRSKN